MIATEQRRPSPDELMGFRPSLERILPVDSEQIERDSLRAHLKTVQAEHARLTRRMEHWDIKPQIYWDWAESQEGFQKDATEFDESCKNLDKLIDRWLRSCDAIERRPHLCSVFTIKPPEKDGRIRFRVAISGSFRICLAKPLHILRVGAKGLLFMFRRKIAEAIEAMASRCQSAITRAVAVLMLLALLDLVAKLATEALDKVRPQLPPRVLSAGGIIGLFVPRW